MDAEARKHGAEGQVPEGQVGAEEVDHRTHMHMSITHGLRQQYSEGLGQGGGMRGLCNTVRNEQINLKKDGT